MSLIYIEMAFHPLKTPKENEIICETITRAMFRTNTHPTVVLDKEVQDWRFFFFLLLKCL